MTGMNERRELFCVECHEHYDEVFFEINRRVGKYTYLKLRCIGCRLTRRTEEKISGGRFRAKARNALLSHAAKYLKTGLIKSARDLIVRFGWDIKRMERDFRDAANGGHCHYCERPFAEMSNGLWDITVDIVDPRDPPFYLTNTHLACQTCNREKASTPPELWELKLMSWKKWRRRDEERKAGAGTLFEYA